MTAVGQRRLLRPLLLVVGLFSLRRWALSVATVLFMTVPSMAGETVSSMAGELVMFESATCEWCEVWHEEIGVVYAKTTEGEVLPLRRVDISDDRPPDLAYVRGIVYTPTFVVTEGGREVGRILGYPGENFFWPMLDELIKKMNRGY